MKIGDTVRVKGISGPSMSINSIQEHNYHSGPCTQVLCYWFTDEKTIKQEFFRQEQLEVLP